MLYEELGLHFEYYDPNPNESNEDRGDCSVRAYAKYFGISWEEAYDELATAGKEVGYIMNSTRSIHAAAKKHNLDFCDDFADDQFMLTGEFLSKIKNKGIKCMVFNDNHAMCFEDNTIYDRTSSESERGKIDKHTEMNFDWQLTRPLCSFIADEDTAEEICCILENKVTKPIVFDK